MSLSVVEKQRSIWRKASKKYTEKNQDRIKQYRTENKEYFAEKTREWAHKNKDKVKEKAKRAYNNLQEKIKILVRAKTSYAFKKKGICEDCGAQCRTEVHHISYEPNKFIETCRVCHNKRHGRKTYVIK